MVAATGVSASMARATATQARAGGRCCSRWHALRIATMTMETVSKKLMEQAPVSVIQVLVAKTATSVVAPLPTVRPAQGMVSATRTHLCVHATQVLVG